MEETLCKLKAITDCNTATIDHEPDDEENIKPSTGKVSSKKAALIEKPKHAGSSTKLPRGNLQEKKEEPDCCKDKMCLFLDTPRVGFFNLEPRSLEESLIGRLESGQTFKVGKGKISKGNVNTARNLLSREFPQVIFLIIDLLL